jgi:hypothetical protein
MRRILCGLLLAAGTVGCTTIGHEKVDGWPALRVFEHYVSAEEIYERCRKYVGFGMIPLACAEFNLAAGRCDLWFNAGFAPRFTVEHERLHCLGYDHPGATNMATVLKRHLAATGQTAKTPLQRSMRAGW